MMFSFTIGRVLLFLAVDGIIATSSFTDYLFLIQTAKQLQPGRFDGEGLKLPLQVPAKAPARTPCIVTPTHVPDFDAAVLMLTEMKRLATDPFLPKVYVVVEDGAEHAQWTAHIARKKDELAEHRVLAFDNISGTSISYILERNAVYDKKEGAFGGVYECMQGSEGTKFTIHLKKLFSVAYVGHHLGCDVAWVIDCDSLPLRRFSFAEVFSQFGILLTRAANFTSFTLVPPGNRTSACASVAELIHKKPLSSLVKSLDFRLNDFWLMETSLVRQMMVETCDDPQCFVNEYLQHGTLSEQVVYNSWLAERIFDGELPDYTVKYMSSLQPCVQTPEINFKCLGDRFSRVLGQKGLWGNFLVGITSQHLADIAIEVPWCVSNCQQENVLKWRGINISNSQ